MFASLSILDLSHKFLYFGRRHMLFLIQPCAMDYTEKVNYIIHSDLVFSQIQEAVLLLSLDFPFELLHAIYKYQSQAGLKFLFLFPFQNLL